MSSKPTISEVIIVEGKHDSIAVKNAVNAETLIVFGLSVRKHIGTIKRCHEDNGVIVFTDPDRNGQRIRDYISKQVRGIKHAYLLKSDAIGENGRIGVQYANSKYILSALQKADGTFIQE